MSELRKRILIVDDSDVTLRILNMIFVREGWDVVTASDGLEAVDRAKESEFDALLTDIDMPRMNGFELVRHIGVEQPNLPVLVMSGGPYRGAAAFDHPNGVVFLRKPSQPAQIVEAMGRACESAQNIPQIRM